MTSDHDETSSFETAATFIEGHAPNEKDVKYTIGPYQIVGKIGQGGMGEVLLGYDVKCGRRIALKKIRKDLIEFKRLHNRFLKEARITSQLTHPAIMPIYSIEDQGDVVYYTMPFVQGETLKQILRNTREQEKSVKSPHHIGESIPALIRIFITVCQGIAYAHSKGVLHRDIKPENVMVGKYGEVLILDWGLAKMINAEEEEQISLKANHHELTKMGKVVGTINFMAHERAKGNPATIQTEVYALGVLLYQILTLRNPFRRGSLEDFRKMMDKETLEDPSEVAPYRDVPRVLSRIALKALDNDPAQRYQTVDELILELENYIEGRSEWFELATLDIRNKEDWEFQENVLIAEHIAITRSADISEWVSLMISKLSFSENTKIEADVTIGENGHGIGFLLCIPEVSEREHLNDGYCLWLGSDLNKTTKLLRSSVEVVDAPEIFLKREKTYRVKIEKIDHNIHFSLNNQLQFSYISHLPLTGTHIGILSRDADFTMQNLQTFTGSQNITINCLAVPDALLAHKLFDQALSEYRRIGYSFPGRAEGREGMFRSGITIIEKSKETNDPIEKERLFDEALLEFERLHSTPGAPLEYLGKAHVYQEMDDIDEEIKCYEIGFRRYPNHPLLSFLREQLIYRMHETARSHRKAAYQFMLTAVKNLPKESLSRHTRKLFESVRKHWEPLPFIESIDETIGHEAFAILLAFWIDNPYALLETIQMITESNELHPKLMANAFFCLIEQGYWELAKDAVASLPSEYQKLNEIALILLTILSYQQSPRKAIKHYFNTDHSQIEFGDSRFFLHLIEQSLDRKDTHFVHQLMEQLDRYELPSVHQHLFDSYRIWAHLYDHDWNKAGALLNRYPLTLLSKEESPLFILYGIWLAATENTEIAEAHFSGVLDLPFPRSYTLLAHRLIGKISNESPWFQRSFQWEKKQLYRQLALYEDSIGDSEKSRHYRLLLTNQ
ncbi:Serine/threonine-protein kinase pknD [Waddlia chondrophila 2032/99]|uniref:Serine/threonine-protein kinase PknD n=2 Tax=Waddlia chondrophila TaxID=71667 RepID=D6YX00_WADCW|nr:serine/threonine-protein kinase PknD [Waddlia chondrophila]ADI38661.1 Serine/threonine protein kinase [Waddlia chondrophila WSU 86-1044]CCB90894.1 Serine/threonine-protein kinase pknD [Waddlia chondrophila 2032/99]